MSSRSVNFSSTSTHKEVYSDYSSGEESNEFYYGGEVNKLHHMEEEMSRTRSRGRMPMSSARFLSEFGLNEDNITIRSRLRDRKDENLRAVSAYVEDSSTDDASLSKVHHYSSSGREESKSATSRSNHLYCSAQGSLNNTMRSDEVFNEKSVRSTSASSQSSSFSYLDLVFNKLRWLFWRCIYHTVCEVLLLDTWILSRCHRFDKKKMLIIMLLLLIPLWLLGAYITDKYSSDDHSGIKILKSDGSLSSLFSLSFLSSWFTSKHQESDSLPVCSDNPGTTKSTWLNMWNIFSVEEANLENSDFSSSSEQNVEISDAGTDLRSNENSISHLDISVPGTQISEEQIKLLALEVFRKESSHLMKELEKSSQDQVHVEQDKIKTVLGEMNLVTSQYQSLSDSLHTLKSEIREQLQSDKTESIESHPGLLHLNSKLQDLEEKLNSLDIVLAAAKNCCKNQSDYLLAESHLASLLMKLMEGHEDENHPLFSGFRSWLKSNFISRNNLSDEIASVIQTMYGNTLKLPQEHYESIARRVAESVIAKSMKSFKHDIINISKTSSSSVGADHYSEGAYTVDDIQKIVKEAILLYDADKTGRVDFALESGGGSVISTRCSETYYPGTARISIFGLPLWYTSKSPRTAIQPEVQPGECWAFQGSQGFLVIQLSATIKPTGFSMEHVPKSLSPTGSIDSAPKDFSVWGLTLEEKDDGMLLGKFTYDSDGDPLQYFPVQTDNEDYFSVIELKIRSNWGNQKYTCLYRFRVHGTPL